MLRDNSLAVLCLCFIRALCCEDGIRADLCLRLAVHDGVGGRNIGTARGCPTLLDQFVQIERTSGFLQCRFLGKDILRFCRDGKPAVCRNLAVHRGMRRGLDDLTEELRGCIRGRVAKSLVLICRMLGIRRQGDVVITRDCRSLADGQFRLDLVFAAAAEIRMLCNVARCAVELICRCLEHNVALCARRRGQRSKPRTHAADIDERGKIQICLALKYRRIPCSADLNLGGAQVNAALRVQRTVDDNGAVCVQRDFPRLKCRNIRRGNHCPPAGQMLVEPLHTRGERRNAARVDDARPADRHAALGQEEYIAADRICILQDVDRAAYVDAIIHKVDELVRRGRAIIEAQICNIVLIEGKVGKGVGRYIPLDLIRHNRPDIAARRDRPRIRCVRLLNIRLSVRMCGCHPTGHAARHCDDRHTQAQRLFLCEFPIAAHDSASFRP